MWRAGFGCWSKRNSSRITLMNADDSVPNSVPPPRELIDGETSGKIIGAFFVVYNTLGFGFLETVYERAMYVALRNRGVHVERQVPFSRDTIPTPLHDSRGADETTLSL